MLRRILEAGGDTYAISVRHGVLAALPAHGKRSGVSGSKLRNLTDWQSGAPSLLCCTR